MRADVPSMMRVENECACARARGQEGKTFRFVVTILPRSCPHFSGRAPLSARLGGAHAPQAAQRRTTAQSRRRTHCWEAPRVGGGSRKGNKFSIVLCSLRTESRSVRQPNMAAPYMRPSFAKLFGIAVVDAETGVAKVRTVGSRSLAPRGAVCACAGVGAVVATAFVSSLAPDRTPLLPEGLERVGAGGGSRPGIRPARRATQLLLSGAARQRRCCAYRPPSLCP